MKNAIDNLLDDQDSESYIKMLDLLHEMVEHEAQH